MLSSLLIEVNTLFTVEPVSPIKFILVKAKQTVVTEGCRNFSVNYFMISIAGFSELHRKTKQS